MRGGGGPELRDRHPLTRHRRPPAPQRPRAAACVVHKGPLLNCWRLPLIGARLSRTERARWVVHQIKSKQAHTELACFGMAFRRATAFARSNSRRSSSAPVLQARVAGMSTSAATRQLFGAFCTDQDDRVSSAFLLGFLERNGLLRDDLRLGQMMKELDSLNAVDTDRALTLPEFAGAT
eukprot:COSAG02_NODE_7964_length_2769_cov_1.170412_3_plen_178_part_01